MSTLIKNIQFLEFNYGDLFDGNICFRFADGKFLFYKQRIAKDKDFGGTDVILTQEQHNLLVSTLNDIHLLDWDKEYSNPHINDSMYWDIEIRYNDKEESMRFSGSNAFPQSSIENGQVVTTNSEMTTEDIAKLLSTLDKIVGQEKYFY